MNWKLSYGSISLIILLLTVGLVYYEIQNAPPKIAAVIVYNAPLLNPFPELEGVVVHINTATQAELEQLPGIGPVKAADIHAYIRQNGPIHTSKALLEVEGIGKQTLENITPFLSFD